MFALVKMVRPTFIQFGLRSRPEVSPNEKFRLGQLSPICPQQTIREVVYGLGSNGLQRSSGI